MDDDVLLPYAHGHGPAHSHRHVRDCQSVLHGNTTHESWPSRNHSGLPPAESSAFVTDVPGSSRWVYGQWGESFKTTLLTRQFKLIGQSVLNLDLIFV